jgi:hypothetical protein
MARMRITPLIAWTSQIVAAIINNAVDVVAVSCFEDAVGHCLLVTIDTWLLVFSAYIFIGFKPFQFSILDSL